jgi:hypothetical protein
MGSNRLTQSKTAKSRCLLLVSILLLVLMQPAALLGQSKPELALEITVPDAMMPKIRVGGRQGAGGGLIRRASLMITDPNAAGGFTAIDVHTVPEGNAIRITLSVIYNDVNLQEWWKNKDEKPGGSYLIREGETARATELSQFGIEPFEMKVISAAPAVLKPGEGPRILNNTTALKVERLEKRLDSYSIWLKNISSKDIIVYSVSSGNLGHVSSSIRFGRPAIAPGATSPEVYMSASDVEQRGVTISLAIFSDRTFEGDAKLAIKFLAQDEGVKTQAPYVLRMIEQTLKVDDSDILLAFEKLEADLWVIPEPLFKPEALAFLKTKFPSQDDKAVMELYEDFKGGLYDARNIALSSMGDTLRSVKDLTKNSQYASATELAKSCLNRVRETLTEIVSKAR